MKSATNNTNEIIIEKSKFITIIYQIHKIEDVKQKLEEVKKMYKNATHYCYAYILDNQEKCSDDGEPSGTAGNPILNVLKKENVNHVLCIVIRYFGGIKLGSGGLIRAYSKSCRQALKIVELNEKIIFSLSFSYNNLREIDTILQDYQILEKKFGEQITYKVIVSTNDYETLKQKVFGFGSLKVIVNDFYC